MNGWQELMKLLEKNRIASEMRARTDYMDFLHNEGLTTADKELLEVAKNAIPITVSQPASARNAERPSRHLRQMYSPAITERRTFIRR